jgi:hypothetical protein
MLDRTHVPNLHIYICLLSPILQIASPYKAYETCITTFNVKRVLVPGECMYAYYDEARRLGQVMAVTLRQLVASTSSILIGVAFEDSPL